MLFGNMSYKPLADMARAAVRNTDNFHWTFITILAFVVYVYATEYQRKNFSGIVAGLALYMVHWLYEITNALSPPTYRFSWRLFWCRTQNRKHNGCSSGVSRSLTRCSWVFSSRLA